MGFSDPVLFALLLATTVAYQITSNFANDYGDGIKGTDNDTRIGPQRVLQSGALSASRLKKGIWVSIAVSLLLTLSTLWHAFGSDSMGYFVLFLLLGGLAIWAAIRYTVGSNAYGYRGLGDLFVFLFFGLLSVLGSLFLYTRQWEPEALFPAVTIGALSTAVLNLNNLRDSESDRLSGKNTLVVQMGYGRGVRYHFALCLLAFISLGWFILLQPNPLPLTIALLPFLAIGVHLRKVIGTRDPSKLDPELKKLALSTFLIALLLYLANDYFL
jgi:1,4-dihydroxy-2-naphthoate octaprenyltransferase